MKFKNTSCNFNYSIVVYCTHISILPAYNLIIYEYLLVNIWFYGSETLTNQKMNYVEKLYI